VLSMRHLPSRNGRWVGPGSSVAGLSGPHEAWVCGGVQVIPHPMSTTFTSFPTREACRHVIPSLSGVLARADGEERSGRRMDSPCSSMGRPGAALVPPARVCALQHGREPEGDQRV